MESFVKNGFQYEPTAENWIKLETWAKRFLKTRKWAFEVLLERHDKKRERKIRKIKEARMKCAKNLKEWIFNEKL